MSGWGRLRGVAWVDDVVAVTADELIPVLNLSVAISAATTIRPTGIEVWLR